MIEDALLGLEGYCHREGFKGWDPFDGLTSRIFKKSPFYSLGIIRLVWIQLFKRLPINFRRLALVPKGYNPKGLALFASGMILFRKLNEAKSFLDILEDMTCTGYAGKSWGYNFDWQARAFYVPVGIPNIVTTVFVTNAFLDYVSTDFADYSDQKANEYVDLAIGACEFILREMIIFEDKSSLCFAYIPGEEARVHNANMLGAALLSRVYTITKNHSYFEKSKKAMTYSVRAMNDDYSWHYGERQHHRFVDNFHTGYNLVALKEWMDYTGERIWEQEMTSAYKYFLDTFWLENGCPKYYNNTLYPIDVHCSAQGIVTCLKLRDYDERSIPMANKIARWAIENMQDKKGYFYYKKTRWHTNKIPYMRWTQAWMFYALALLSNEYKTHL